MSFIQSSQIMKMDKDFILSYGPDLDKCCYIWRELFMIMKNMISKIKNMKAKLSKS